MGLVSSSKLASFHGWIIFGWKPEKELVFLLLHIG